MKITRIVDLHADAGWRQFKDYFENYSMDVGIVDLPESARIETFAELDPAGACATHHLCPAASLRVTG